MGVGQEEGAEAAFPGHEGGRQARLYCSGVPWGSQGGPGGRPQPEEQRGGWDGSQLTAMQTDAFIF